MSALITAEFWPSAGLKPSSHEERLAVVTWPMKAFVKQCSGSKKRKRFALSGNDDALLRWNTCARMMARNQLAPQEHEQVEPPLE